MTTKCTFLKKETRNFGRCTVVTLTCKVSLPWGVEKSVYDWIRNHSQIKGVKCNSLPDMTFTMSGKAIRNQEDADDPVTGARIAESRAKKKVYRFCEGLFWIIAKDFDRKFITYNNVSKKFAEHYGKEVIHYNRIMEMQ